MGELIYGTSSWSEPSWVGGFYPRGMQQSAWITHYAGRMPAVEADVTYYRVPSRRMVEGWYRRTPDDFVLAAKFPRDVVHAGKGATPDSERLLMPGVVGDTASAFLEAMACLGKKCGPLVLQFPYMGKKTFESLEAFLDRLGAFLEWLPDGFSYAVEVRNRRWLVPELCELLRRHGAALVLVDLRYMPHPAEVAEQLDLVTADFLYGRLIGDRKAMDAVTDRFDRVVIPRADRLEQWAKLVSDLATRVQRAFVFANNHYEGHAPATVASLLRLLGRDEDARRVEGGQGGELPFG